MYAQTYLRTQYNLDDHLNLFEPPGSLKRLLGNMSVCLDLGDGSKVQSLERFSKASAHTSSLAKSMQFNVFKAFHKDLGKEHVEAMASSGGNLKDVGLWVQKLLLGLLRLFKFLRLLDFWFINLDVRHCGKNQLFVGSLNLNCFLSAGAPLIC